MLIRIMLIITLLSLGMSTYFYYQNQDLNESILVKDLEISSLNSVIQVKEIQIEATNEAMKIAHTARVAAEQRASEALKIRDAINEGDYEELSDVDGSLGAAIRLLGQYKNSCNADISGSDGSR